MTARAPARPAISPAAAADADWLAAWCLGHPSAAARAEDERSARRARSLARCLDDGSVLIASGYREGEPEVGGVAALDLDRAEITELTFESARPAEELVRKLLAETERLAVRFGIDALTVSVPARRHERFLALGYRVVERPGAAANVVLERSLARRQTRYSRRVHTIAAELGISADYGRCHRLQIQPEAQRLASIGPDVFGRVQRLTPAAARAWRGMVAAAARGGVVLQAVSAFRDVDYQRGLVERKLSRGQEIGQILAVSAAPGFSEHHTGNAVDVTTPGSELLEESFERTAAFGWLADHAREHGFRLSFPRNNRHGLAYEPWHWCFRG